MSTRGRVIAIVGPTASGKSKLADEVAARLGTAVISVDSMQVYRGMDIGTAKTPPEERKVPLEMVDVADVGTDFSVQMFQDMARGCADDLISRGLVPVLCGGTGLYLDAVIDEMEFPKGQTNGKVRQHYEEIAKTQGGEKLFSILMERDPESARLIHPNNVRRVARALEMLDDGTSYAVQHQGLKSHRPHYDALIFGIDRPREQLYDRIDRRVDQMVSDGLVQEVRALLARGLRESTTASQAIGYKEVIAYLDGQCDMGECVTTIKTRSRRYAKRQISWLRRDGRTRWIDMNGVSLDDAAERIVSEYQGLGDN